MIIMRCIRRADAKAWAGGRPVRASAAPAAPRSESTARGSHMAERLLEVLFLCTGNSARSIMAEAILGRVGIGRFRAHSAGSAPAGEIHPHARELLRRLGYPVDELRSKGWEELAAPDAPDLDFVFTVCDNAAAETCPVWPGQPTSAHWGVPDPASAQGDEAEIAAVFADAYRMLSNRIDIFVSLPFASLDRLALQRQLDEIGRRPAGGAP